MVRKEVKKQLLKETFKSKIIQDIMLDSATKKIIKDNLRYLGSIAWDQLEDSDIVRTEPKNGRKKQFEDALIFWMSDENKLLATSYGNYVKDTKYSYNYRRRGRPDAEFKSTLALSTAADHIYIITKETQDKYSVQQKRSDRSTSKFDVLAWKDNSKVKDDNITRYKNIISKKKSDNADIDNKIKEIMINYNKNFENIITNVDPDNWKQKSKVENLGNSIQKLLMQYGEYIYIQKSLDKGSAYVFQTQKIQEIINYVNKLYDSIPK
jgi:hypothetical protein